jgi:hypothetical protein
VYFPAIHAHTHTHTNKHTHRYMHRMAFLQDMLGLLYTIAEDAIWLMVLGLCIIFGFSIAFVLNYGDLINRPHTHTHRNSLSLGMSTLSGQLGKSTGTGWGAVVDGKGVQTTHTPAVASPRKRLQPRRTLHKRKW